MTLEEVAKQYKGEKDNLMAKRYSLQQKFETLVKRKTKVEWGLVSLAHNLRKYVAYKAKSKQKQVQSMVLVLEKPALKPAV
jgi:hypothetical protein